MIFDDSANEKKYTDVRDGIKNKIKAINGYEKDYMKITSTFSSDDNLPVNKPLIFHAMTIIIRSAVEEDRKLYPQVSLDGCLYEL